MFLAHSHSVMETTEWNLFDFWWTFWELAVGFKSNLWWKYLIDIDLWSIDVKNSLVFMVTR